MVNIKSKSVKDTIGWWKKKRGPEGMRKLSNALSAEDRKFMASLEFSALTWIPLSTFIRLMKAALREFSSGNIDEFLTEAKEIAEYQLRGVYHALIRMGSPGLIAKRAGVALKMYFQGAEVEVEKIGPKNSRTTFSGFEKEDYLIELVILAWVERALTISGANNLDVRIVTSLREGKGYFVIEDKWE